MAMITELCTVRICIVCQWVGTQQQITSGTMFWNLQGIKTLSSLQVPVYVTETGIPDRTGNKREKFFKTYIPQVRAPCNASWAHTGNTYALFCIIAMFLA